MTICFYFLTENVAQGKPATQSGISSFYKDNPPTADKAVDGDKITRVMSIGSCMSADSTNGYTPSGDPAWWQVDLGQEYDVFEVRITTVSYPLGDKSK